MTKHIIEIKHNIDLSNLTYDLFYKIYKNDLFQVEIYYNNDDTTLDILIRDNEIDDLDIDDLNYSDNGFALRLVIADIEPQLLYFIECQCGMH